MRRPLLVPSPPATHHTHTRTVNVKPYFLYPPVMIPAGKLSTNITPLGESKPNKNRVFISALNVLQTYQAYKNIKWYVSRRFSIYEEFQSQT